MLNPSGEYYGVEPGNFDEEDVKKHGLNVFGGTLEEAHYSNDYFDVVTIADVFEHVPNPSEVMKEIVRVLKPNGTLILGTLNYRSLACKLFGRHWSDFSAAHLFIFSDKNLKEYVEKFNLKLEKTRYGCLGDPIIFIKSGIYYFNNFFFPEKNLWKIFSKRMQERDIFFLLIFVGLFILLFPFTFLLNILKFGGTVEIWCKK